MIRRVKWEFYDMENTVLVIGGKVMVSKGLYADPVFSIVGLGLTKAEREFFGRKFLQRGNVITISIGKLIVSYNREGYKHHMRHVDIVSDKILV